MERFKHRPLDFVDIVDPCLIYIGVGKGEDFDKIAYPVLTTARMIAGTS